MTEIPNLAEIEALRQAFPDAIIPSKKDKANAPKPRIETLKMRKSQGLNQISNVRTIRINDDKYDKDETGESLMIYNVSVTVGSSLDDHDDELDKIQRAVTEFVRNIHNHID